jgi:hypothetical protein
MKKDFVIAVDPSLNSLGWASWFTEKSLRTGLPTDVGLLKAKRSKGLVGRSIWLGDQLHTIIDGRECVIVCEMPAYHGSMMGWAAGDLQKLVFLVGALAGYFNRLRFVPVTPNEWKGQLPKKVVINRLIKRFGPGATRHWEKDVWDAVGIGLYHLGKF